MDMSVDIGLNKTELSGPTEPIPAKSAQVKTDKPRPHVCATCTRSFARLEHLKRHERSHTKEKPFQCPVCERCFARRDLLLRHKQKLHASFPFESTRSNSTNGNNIGGGIGVGAPRATKRKASNASRISTSSATTMIGGGGGGGSTSPSSSPTGRSSSVGSFDNANGANGHVSTAPYSNLLKSQLGTGIRSNTISEGIIPGTKGGLNDNNSKSNNNNNNNLNNPPNNPGNHPTNQPNLSHLNNRPRPASFSASSAASYSKYKDIDAINNQMYPAAPPQVGFSTPQLLPASLENIDMSLDDIFVSDPLFINPQLLGQGQKGKEEEQAPGQAQQAQQAPGALQHQQNQNQPIHSFMQNQTFNESIYRDNTRSSISSSYKLDEDLSPNSVLAMEHDDFSWMPPSENYARPNPQNILNTAGSFSPTYNGSNGSINITNSESPLSLAGGANAHGGVNLSPTSNSINQMNNSNNNNNAQTVNDYAELHNGHSDHHLSPTSMINHEDMRDHKAFSLHIDGMDFWNNQPFDESSLNLNNNGNINTSLGMRNRGQIITPQLRLHILATLSTPTPFSSSQPPQLPSTLELQRYINSYTENFGKHMPFLHHSLEFTPDNVPLALGMAAIGALYTFEHASSINIFEISRSCIHVYLESRREKRGSEDSNNNGSNGNTNKTTPIWLVQALVLGIIYGLFSSEPLANEIAVAQANAVISLAKSAGLHLPPSKYIQQPTPDLDNCHIEDKWRYFISVQERIRTMHVVHMISCLLATSYNVVSSLKNEDMKCGSPCDESLWTSTSSSEWWDIISKKGLDMNLRQSFEGPNFNDYLQQLLSKNTLMGKVPQFTLLSLLYAVHHEIYLRRHGHDSSIINAGITPSQHEITWLETQKLNIESILRAWETTWSLSPLASLSPSSQYGPLMSDAIPLSSLAHVRVYINLSKVKEAFWRRDFAAMNHELDSLAIPTYYESITNGSPSSPRKFDGLLEAASYAADAISLWEKHSIKWTLETTASQTFIHTLVSLFDCGLAVSEFIHRLELRPQHEWSEDESMLVNRIGKIFYRVLDVVGHDSLDFNDNSGTMQPLNEDGTLTQPGKLSVLTLLIVSKMLCKAYIWPFALVMGDALQVRSRHLSGFSM